MVARSRWLGASFAALTGRALVPGPDPADAGFARALFDHPQPVVSHGTEADPIFAYANRAALTLWDCDWDHFTRLPSRLSAEADGDIQADRNLYLAEAAARGWVADYQGIRVAVTGRRFRITRTILWTVRDETGGARGQAALIGQVLPV